MWTTSERIAGHSPFAGAPPSSSAAPAWLRLSLSRNTLQAPLALSVEALLPCLEQNKQTQTQTQTQTRYGLVESEGQASSLKLHKRKCITGMVCSKKGQRGNKHSLPEKGRQPARHQPTQERKARSPQQDQAYKLPCKLLWGLQHHRRVWLAMRIPK